MPIGHDVIYFNSEFYQYIRVKYCSLCGVPMKHNKKHELVNRKTGGKI